MPSRSALLVPCLLIVIGTGWLLSALGVAPQINWIWTLGLAGIGLLSFVLSGVHKLSESRRHAPSVVIGVACCRASVQPESWRGRAELALARAREDGAEGYHLVR